MQRLCPFFLNFEGYIDPESDTKSYPPLSLTELEALVVKWTEAWEESKLRKRVTTVFDTHAQEMRLINKIVCFGLSFIKPVKNGRNNVQHLAACHIAQTLKKAQNSDKIEIFAQDPLIWSRPAH
jgi:hypothetical protein